MKIEDQDTQEYVATELMEIFYDWFKFREKIEGLVDLTIKEHWEHSGFEGDPGDRCLALVFKTLGIEEKLHDNEMLFDFPFWESLVVNEIDDGLHPQEIVRFLIQEVEAIGQEGK